jgi:hypothetical protein
MNTIGLTVLPTMMIPNQQIYKHVRNARFHLWGYSADEFCRPPVKGAKCDWMETSADTSLCITVDHRIGKMVEIVQFEVNFLKDGARKYWTRERERSYHWKSLTISTTARADFSSLFFDMVTCFRGYHYVVLRYYTGILSGLSAWLFFEGYVQDLSIMADWPKQMLQKVMRAVQCHRTVNRQRGSVFVIKMTGGPICCASYCQFHVYDSVCGSAAAPSHNALHSSRVSLQ